MPILSHHETSDALAAPKPADLTVLVCDALTEKTSLPAASMTVLGLLAGGYVAFGAIFATVALAGADVLPHGVGQVLAGLVFTFGLVLVMVAGAELFTGNTLMAGLLVTRKLSLRPMLAAWSIVYVSNLVGAVFVAMLVMASGLHSGGDGGVGHAALKLAESKGEPDFATAFASGILANMLVCLAVWMSYAAKSVGDKVIALLLPISAFVAAGFEHSVANMFLIPYGWMVKSFAAPGFWESIGAASSSFPSVSFAGFAANLIPVTLGNIIGGLIISIAYLTAYRGKPA